MTRFRCVSFDNGQQWHADGRLGRKVGCYIRFGIGVHVCRRNVENVVILSARGWPNSHDQCKLDLLFYFLFLAPVASNKWVNNINIEYIPYSMLYVRSTYLFLL